MNVRRWVWWIGALILVTGALGERRGARLYRGELRTQLQMADQMAAWLEARAGRPQINAPGGVRFDGEWALVTCKMALLGFAQIVRHHPETAPRFAPAARQCVAWMTQPDALNFGTAAYGAEGLAGLDGQPTHAYLGYVNVALGAYREIQPQNPYTDLHDALTASLAQGMRARIRAFETYPGEVYPPDQAVVASSVAMHARLTGSRTHSALVADWATRFQAIAVDPETGMVFQALSPIDGHPVDRPRGSGTAFSAYFLAEVDPALSAALYDALDPQTLLGFRGIREYPRGERGWGDIDSGPVLLGVSVAATGFGVAGARIHQDAKAYRRLVRTATLFGVPIRGWHWTGGGIGNAIMLAMLTAPPQTGSVSYPGGQ